MTVRKHSAPVVREIELAKALLSLADTAGMPDSFWRTDSRVALAREMLGVSQDERYSRVELWAWPD